MQNRDTHKRWRTRLIRGVKKWGFRPHLRLSLLDIGSHLRRSHPHSRRVDISMETMSLGREKPNASTSHNGARASEKLTNS